MILVNKVYESKFKLVDIGFVGDHSDFPRGLDKPVGIFVDRRIKALRDQNQAVLIDTGEHAEIQPADNAVIEHKAVAGMRVGLKEAVKENLLEDGFCAVVGDFFPQF